MNTNFQQNLDTVINIIKAQKNPNKYLEEQLNIAMNNNPMLRNIIPLLFNKNPNNTDLDKMMSSICNEYGINVKDSMDYIKRNIK